MKRVRFVVAFNMLLLLLTIAATYLIQPTRLSIDWGDLDAVFSHVPTSTPPPISKMMSCYYK